MQKRNVILLIITLGAITLGFFIYLYMFPSTKPLTQNTDSGSFNFFPFGSTPKKGTTDNPANISGIITNNPLTDNPVVNNAKIKKISSFPVAGYGIYNKQIFQNIPLETPSSTPMIDQTATSTPKKAVAKTPAVKPTPPPTILVTTVRYVNKETGNIYQTPADNISETKYTATIIPKIYESFFANNSGQVIMRYLKEDYKTIETYLGTLPVEVLGGDSTNTNEIKGSFLPENITDMSVSPDESNIFYLINSNNSTVGVTAGALGDKKTQIFNSAFNGWITQWPNAKIITITTKAAAGYPGYMYSIDPSMKTINKVIGGISGLTTLMSPSGNFVLYNTSNNGTVSLNIYHTDTGNSDQLGIKTLPEKCVWAKASSSLYCAVPRFMDSAKYPDDWYKGLISFGDEIWKVDLTNGNAKKIADSVQTTGEEVDGIKLGIDDGENYLFFINKKDGYLWELNLK
ncbi:MAG: hypothetical protein NTW62_02235 [Candidatus Nomurabacteria bacterium]|nr:hypothetical protein [Candidatus Nomurabacteria bacterium]